MSQQQHGYTQFTRHYQKPFITWKFIASSVSVVLGTLLVTLLLFVFPGVPVWLWMFLLPVVLILVALVIIFFAIVVVCLAIMAMTYCMLFFLSMPWWLPFAWIVASAMACGVVLLYVMIFKKVRGIQRRRSARVFSVAVPHMSRIYEQGY